MSKIIFATSNMGRFLWLQHELELAGLHDVELEQRKLSLTEIQSMNLAEISLHKAQQAYELVQRPVLVMDGGFYIDGLNGFPAAYTHDMLETVGLENMAKIAGVLDDKRCSFRSVATFITGPDQYQQFFDTTGDVFTLTDKIWPTDHPKQWSALWRMVVPTKFGFDIPLAGLPDDKMTEFLEQRKVFAGPPALQQVVDYLRNNNQLAA